MRRFWSDACGDRKLLYFLALELTAGNLQYIILDQYSGIHYPNSYERLYEKTNLKES